MTPFTNPPLRGDHHDLGPHPVNRFTEAELCAEHWHSWNLFKTGNDGTSRDWTEYDRGQVFRRFAMAAHFDEVGL